MAYIYNCRIVYTSLHYTQQLCYYQDNHHNFHVHVGSFAIWVIVFFYIKTLRNKVHMLYIASAREVYVYFLCIFYKWLELPGGKWWTEDFSRKVEPMTMVIRHLRWQYLKNTKFTNVTCFLKVRISEITP